MIEADGNKRWGGVFEADVKDGLTACKASSSKPKILKKFDDWDEGTSSLASSNPYMPNYKDTYLTTARDVSETYFNDLSEVKSR